LTVWVVLRFSLLTACLLAVSACSVGERPTLLEAEAGDGPLDAALVASAGPAGAETDAAAMQEDTTPEPDATSNSEGEQLAAIDLGDLPPALVSPLGVVVPVLGGTETGYLVQTPCGNEQELLWGQPLREADVVIDPGHGGDERGAIGPSGEAEADLNLDVARRVASTLDSQGISVALSRTGDYRIPVATRAALADRLEAKVFVSIHHNSPTPVSGPANGPGTEVYVQVGSDASKRLGGLVYEEVLAALSVFDADWATRSDAGVLTVLNTEGEDAYGIVRRPAVPSVLVELAYISNSTEATVLATPEYRQAAGDALAGAIVRFLQTGEEGSGHIDEPRFFDPSGATGGDEGCVDPALE